MLAGSLIERLRRARRDGPTLAVIRHAARHEIAAADMEQAYRTPLTDAGREDAAALGALLPTDLRLVHFHSPVPRCADTAARIAEGFRAAGGTARDGGDLDALGAEYVRDASVVLRSFAVRGRRTFVRDWCSGALGADLIQEPCAAGRHVLRTLVDLRSPAPPDELHLHITHDLTLITLLALILDPTAPRFPWPPFLDGVVLSLQPDRVIWHRTAKPVVTDRDGSIRLPTR
ncbi:MAG: histidine phosphatase family protein [Deltaproteobacteria bacterium]|nr:histidine phosphatase family protein [Deltaproteobacteria bacterium]